MLTLGFAQHLAALLRRWCSSEPLTHDDESDLIGSTLRIVRHDPGSRRGLRALASLRNTSESACAMSELGDMFKRDPENVLNIWLAAYLELDDATLVARFGGIAVRHMRQCLQKAFTTELRNQARLHRSMWLALERFLPDVKLFPADSPRWASVHVPYRVRDDRPRIVFEEAVRRLVPLASSHHTLPALIGAFLRDLAGDCFYCGAVHIEDVLYPALDEVFRQGLLADEELRFSMRSAHPRIQMVIREGVSAGRKAVAPILAGYRRRGLSPDIAAAYERFCDDVLNDYAESGSWPGEYREYLRRYLNNPDQGEYEGSHKARVEYLAPEAKAAFDAVVRSRAAESVGE